MTPLLGDLVRYVAARDDGGVELLVALVTRVWTRDVVNLCVFSADGRATPAASVWLDESRDPATGTWHPMKGT